MKIAIVGYGKMGRMVARAATEQGFQISAVVDPSISAEEALPVGAKPFRAIAGAGNLGGADVAIEFTQPATVLANIKALAEIKMPMVIGTTGWTRELSQARDAVINADTALIWSSNFSLGVNVFYQIAWYAARLFDAFPEYDVGGFEAHHNKKLDSPSGTAKTLVDGVLERMSGKDSAVWQTLDRKPLPGELHFPSLRVGSVPGRHSLFFDSAADTIEITHTARNREGFASGAVLAAKWLSGGNRPRKGFFGMDDMIKDMLKLPQA